MNNEWQSFLTDKGAQFNEDGRISTFGIPEIERYLVKNGPVLASLAHQGLLKVTGSEAFDFLQGQLTNELKDVNENTAQLSAYCDPQGQVLALFTIFKWQDAYYLSFDSSLKEVIQKRLQMFVMRSDVQIEDTSDEIIQIAYAGDFADLDMQRLLSTKIKKEYEVGAIDHDEVENAIAIKVPGPYHKYLLFGDLASIKVAWEKLRNNSEATNNFDWRLMDVVAGNPEVTAASSGKLIAQFLNLDKLNAINFKKGCYPGQEVIARMHYRGKVVKRMFRLRVEEANQLNPGDEFKLTDASDKSYSFTCVQATDDVLRGSVCLAVSTIKSLSATDGDLKTASGASVTIEPLPYDLAEEA